MKSFLVYLVGATLGTALYRIDPLLLASFAGAWIAGDFYLRWKLNQALKETDDRV